MSDVLYVVVDNTTGDPILGGGSSSKPFVRAFTDHPAAERSARGTWARDKSVYNRGYPGVPTVVKYIKEEN